MQPIERANDGVIRFRRNRIVRWLVDTGRVDLNEVLIFAKTARVPAEEMEQFWQLMGYSVSGFGDLDFVRPETVEAADKAAATLTKS